MRIDIGPGPAPALGGLEELDAWATERGLTVSRNYQWAWQDDDGTEWPGFWYVTLIKEQKNDIGVIRAYYITISDDSVRRGSPLVWENLAKLLEASFERMINESAILEEEL